MTRGEIPREFISKTSSELITSETYACVEGTVLNLREIECGNIEWIHLEQDRV